MSLYKRLLLKILHPFAKESIVFESVPDFSDNTKAVYDELITRPISKKYYLIWTTNNNNYISKEKFAYFDKKQKPHFFDINKPSTIYQYLLYISYYDKPKCGICCNQVLSKRGKAETLFYLGHGSNIKSTKSYYGISKEVDYYIAESEYLRPIDAYEHSFDVNKVVALGYPRTDVFSRPVTKRADITKPYKKVIIWYPTFRQHKSGFKTDTYSIPVIHNEQSAVDLNNTCVEQNILLIIKPHFAQDVSYIKDLHLSNIIFINDEFFTANDITSYELVASCDALLTDYSSIYYDFTLCDKPIGVIWEDIEEYRSCPGFAVDLDQVMKGAEKIYTLQELQQFVTDISNNIDKLRTQRQEICKLANYSNDGKSSRRVIDFIIEKAGL